MATSQSPWRCAIGCFTSHGVRFCTGGSPHAHLLPAHWDDQVEASIPGCLSTVIRQKIHLAQDGGLIVGDKRLQGKDPISCIDNCLSWIKPSLAQTLEKSTQKDHDGGGQILVRKENAHAPSGWRKMKHVAHIRAYGPARGTRLPAAGTSDQAKSKLLACPIGSPLRRFRCSPKKKVLSSANISVA